MLVLAHVNPEHLLAPVHVRQRDVDALLETTASKEEGVNGSEEEGEWGSGNDNGYPIIFMLFR